MPRPSRSHRQRLLWLRCVALCAALLAAPARPHQICLVNRANNPRTASVFSRGVLAKHHSRHNYTVVSGSAEDPCPESATVRIFLVQGNAAQQMYGSCVGTSLCILTGDETCFAPTTKWPVSHTRWLMANPPGPAMLERFVQASKTDPCHHFEPGFEPTWEDVAPNFHFNVIMREYYSSKYPLPGLPLGARFEFLPVPPAVRDRGHRHLLFNFLGSVKPEGEVDREIMRDVVLNHTWKVPYRFKTFDALVREPDEYTVEEYRVVLLASSFTLAPVGTADDTFRFWEAIEAGSIPIIVRRTVSRRGWQLGGDSDRKPLCPDAFEDVLRTRPPVVLLPEWQALPSFLESVTETEIEDRRARLAVWNDDFWRNTTQTIDRAVSNKLAQRWQARQNGECFQ